MSPQQFGHTLLSYWIICQNFTVAIWKPSISPVTAQPHSTEKKKHFFLLSNLIYEYTFQSTTCTWNFLEVGQDKGLADGIGSAIKRQTDKMVLVQGKGITSAKDLLDELLSTATNVKNVLDRRSRNICNWENNTMLEHNSRNYANTPGNRLPERKYLMYLWQDHCINYTMSTSCQEGLHIYTCITHKLIYLLFPVTLICNSRLEMWVMSFKDSAKPLATKYNNACATAAAEILVNTGDFLTLVYLDIPYIK